VRHGKGAKDGFGLFGWLVEIAEACRSRPSHTPKVAMSLPLPLYFATCFVPCFAKKKEKTKVGKKGYVTKLLSWSASCFFPNGYGKKHNITTFFRIFVFSSTKHGTKQTYSWSASGGLSEVAFLVLFCFLSCNVR
jgi:hypothetical protein